MASQRMQFVFGSTSSDCLAAERLRAGCVAVASPELASQLRFAGGRTLLSPLGPEADSADFR
eukprot:14143059-Alexandrium_andersonii.AAC.1